MSCACGVDIEMADIQPATAELFMDRFDKTHTHDADRALANVTTPMRIGDHSDDSDD